MAKQGAKYTPTKEDREFVEQMVMAGSSILKIAECLNLHDDTLRKNFRYEIVTGRERLKANAVRVLMDSLTDGSLDAAKFVLSRIAGWNEKMEMQADLTSSDGSFKPAVIQIVAAQPKK
jgi:hypothetical protein